MLLKCHYHLHPLVEIENAIVDSRIDEDYSLNIFEMIVSTSKLTKKLG
jgi:hypothetical protein